MEPQQVFLSLREPAAAKQYRIDTWRKVNPQNIREVKAHLNAGYQVLIGVMADDRLIGLHRDTVWGAPSGTVRGGHAGTFLLIERHGASRSHRRPSFHRRLRP